MPTPFEAFVLKYIQKHGDTSEGRQASSILASMTPPEAKAPEAECEPEPKPQPEPEPEPELLPEPEPEPAAAPASASYSMFSRTVGETPGEEA